MTRAVVVVVVIIVAAVAGVVAVDQEGVGGGKLLHTPALRTVGTGAGFRPEDVQRVLKSRFRGQEETLAEIEQYLALS